ncbi:Ms4527A family Cys-rich leader peptide [Mycolicibacterium sp. S2-37]
MCASAWHNRGVTAGPNSTTRVSLVTRRHVDFKRVCTSCCLP